MVNRRMSLPVGLSPHRYWPIATTADRAGPSSIVRPSSREASIRVARARRVSMTSKPTRTPLAAAAAFSGSWEWVATAWPTLICEPIHASQASVELRRLSG